MLNLLVFKGENGETESGDQHRQTVTTLHQVSENMDRQLSFSAACQGKNIKQLYLLDLSLNQGCEFESALFRYWIRIGFLSLRRTRIRFFLEGGI